MRRLNLKGRLFCPFFARIRHIFQYLKQLPQTNRLRKSKLSKGKSFAEAKPELLSEWNYSKNEIIIKIIKQLSVSERKKNNIFILTQFVNYYA